MKKLINVTPHPIRFSGAHVFAGEYYSTNPCLRCGAWQDEADDIPCVYNVPPSGVLVNARPVEEAAGVHASGAELVRTRFVADPASEEALAKLEAKYPDAVIVGSIIAAQAFPGRVLALVPAPGFERVPPAEKRMRDDKFTTTKREEE